MSATFLGGASVTDPLANLLKADLSGLPPIYVQTGGDESLLDDSVRFEKKAKAAGVDIKFDIYPEMQHVFHFMAGNAPEADDAIAKLAAWVKPKLGL
jgi:epsilon-lactone hydrolase